MAENSKIEWTTHTFNPWRGCQKVADGCTNCYADALSKRNPGTLGIWGSEQSGATRVVASESMWREPLKWNREYREKWTCCNDPSCDLCEGTGVVDGIRPRVFCASLADVFEDWQGPMLYSNRKQLFSEDIYGPWGIDPDEPVTMNNVRDRLFQTIDSTPNLDWLLLTKRPNNIRKMWAPFTESRPADVDIQSKRHNVWLGYSIADQKDVAAAITLGGMSDLCAKRFLSIEPLVAAVDISDVLAHNPPIDWVIVGGESGPSARPCNAKWIQSIVRQCEAAGVPVFVKQWGSNPRQDMPATGREVLVSLKDKKGGSMNEWPAGMNVRQLPGD